VPIRLHATTSHFWFFFMRGAPSFFYFEEPPFSIVHATVAQTRVPI
jgi:hypothetical protein